MNYLLDVSLNDGTIFYLSKGVLEVGGKIYENRINSMTQFSDTLTLGRSFETPSMTFKLADHDKIFRSHFEDALDAGRNTGSEGQLKQADGTLIKKLKLTGARYEGHYTYWTFSQNTDLINNNLLDVITEQEYPNAVQDAFGKPIPKGQGTINGGGNNGTYSAWKVDLDGTKHYLLGDQELTSVDRVVHLGTNIASGWSLVNYNNKAYLNYAGGTADTVEVNVTKSSGSITAFIDDFFDRFFGSLGYDSDSAFIDRLERILYLPSTSVLSTWFDQQLKGQQLLYLFCQFACCQWKMDSNGKIDLSYISCESQVGKEVATFIEADVDGIFKLDQKINEIKNKISWKFKWVNLDNAYKWDFLFHKMESQDNSGVFDDTVENRFTDYDSIAFGSAKYKANMNQYPQCVLTGVKFAGRENVQKFLDNDLLGSVIKLTHSKALTTDPRYYRIERVSFNFDDKEFVSCTLRDVTFLNSFEDHVFLFHSGYFGVGNNSGYFFDFAPNYTHGIQRYGGIVHSTTQARFKNASAFFEDIQTIKPYAKTPNLFKIDCENMTVGGRFYIPDATPVAAYTPFSLFYIDNNNRIQPRHMIDGSMEFYVYEAGSGFVDGTGVVFTTNGAWYFICFAKVGSDWGLYVGEKDSGTIQQVAYGSLSVSGSAPLLPYFGSRGALNQFAQNTYGDGFFVIRKNIFDLAPDSGDSDSFSESLVQYAITDRFFRGY